MTKPSPLSPRLLSSEHAARYLGISRPTLYDLPIGYVTIGQRGHRRYDVHDLDAYVDRLRAEQASRPKRKAS